MDSNCGSSAPGSQSHRQAVAFGSQPEVKYIEKAPLESNRRPLQSRLRMAKRLYENYHASQVTDSMLQEASRLFSEHYGVWGKNAASVVGAFAKEGKLVQNGPVSFADTDKETRED
jgi:hypothetical protein